MLPAIEVETGPRPTATVIWLHGLGDDGHGWSEVVPALALPAALPVRFLFPHAPAMPVTINNGFVMRAWYDIRDADLHARADLSGVRRSQALLETMIAHERARGIAAARIVLAGFSQGCAITLLAGLRYRERLAGLAGLSGYLPLADTTAGERDSANHDTPVFLAHGRSDPMVPIARGMAARDALAALGHDVQWEDYPMEHSVCMEEVTALNRWLLQVWA